MSTAFAGAVAARQTGILGRYATRLMLAPDEGGGLGRIPAQGDAVLGGRAIGAALARDVRVRQNRHRRATTLSIPRRISGTPAG
jgi:hypothetical protein